MSLTLPKPVTNYLAAVEAKDTDMLALCFATMPWCMTKAAPIAGSMP